MLVKNYFTAEDTCIRATYMLAKCLKVPITKSSLQNDLLSHPNYPSLFTITEVLKKYSVDSIAVKVTRDELENVSTPYLVYLHDILKNRRIFVVVKSVSGGFVEISTKKGKFESISINEFLKRWTGVLLIPKQKEDSGEIDFKRKKISENIKAIKDLLPVIALLTAFLIFLIEYIDKTSFSLVFSSLLLTSFLGGSVSIILALIDENPKNSLLKTFCNVSRAKDCDSILSSRGSKILGFKLSHTGVIYFVTSFLMLLISGTLEVETSFFLSWLSLITIPMILYSIVYQWRVAKKWCFLCLMIQALLTFQVVVSLFTIKNYSDYVSLPYFLYSNFLICLVVALLLVDNIVSESYLNNTLENNRKLNKIKYDSGLFRYLLSQSRTALDSNGIGVTLGAINAPNEILMISNPWCYPCKKTFLELESIIKNNNNTKLRLIFLVDSKDLSSIKIVNIFLNSSNLLSDVALNSTISEWYSEGSDFKEFVLPYEDCQSFSKVSNKIKEMNDWCKKAEIRKTPTVFLNSREIPKIYQISDLNHFLKDF